MKIVGWNLKNISANKLKNGFSNTFKAFGLGNNVLDYVANVVMGNTQWSNLWSGTPYAGLSNNPADIFVVIELKTGGSGKGKAVSSKCTNTLATIVATMNTISNNRGLTSSYDYDYATPLIVGHTETVGIIYNKVVFKTSPATAVLKAGMNYILPRTPFMASLVRQSNNNVINVVGVHAPPEVTKKGTLPGQNNKPPIDFSNELGNVTELDTTIASPKEDYIILGDFNCNPSSQYTSYKNGKKKQVNGFVQLATWGYATKIANGTLSSVRVSVDSNFTQPANYLSGAFDNLFYSLGASTPTTNNGYVLDLIGNARNVAQTTKPSLYPTNLVATLNAFNVVSDHLPMILEFA